jgi:hypothetical protein
MLWAIMTHSAIWVHIEAGRLIPCLANSVVVWPSEKLIFTSDKFNMQVLLVSSNLTFQKSVAVPRITVTVQVPSEGGGGGSDFLWTEQ